jgi:hypothetical protein
MTIFYYREVDAFTLEDTLLENLRILVIFASEPEYDEAEWISIA